MSDLPRLLFCCFDVVPGPSATSRRLSEYVKGLTDRFQVVVLSVKTPDHPHIEKFQGARLLRVPVGSGDLTARLEAFDRAVRRQLESEEYMLVHFFDPFGGLALAEKRGEYQYKLVYDACLFPSIELPYASPEPGAASRKLVARARRQELFCLMSSDAVIVGNPLTRDWVTTLGVEREQVHVLHAPVDLAPYAQVDRGRPDGEPMNVVHLGSLAGHHGLPGLLEAVAEARRSVALKLTLVGPSTPEWRARLRGQADALGLAGVVDLQDPVVHEDLPKVLATADVGALTLDDVERSRIVGAPLSRLGEYLAAGRPVLAADTPASRHLVPEEAAVWYRPGDTASLSEALVKLARDVPLRLRLGEAAREATARWDGAKIRADLVVLYAQVTGTRAPRALDEETFDPDGVTLLGRGRAEGGEDSRPRRAPPASGQEGTPNTSKVIVAMDAHRVSTDPAIARPGSSPGSRGRLELPAVMGVLLHEEVPPPPPPAPLPPIPPLPAFGAEERPEPTPVAGPPPAPRAALPSSATDEELPELADGEVEELEVALAGEAAAGRTGRVPSGPRAAAPRPPDPPGLELTEGPGPLPETSFAERRTIPPTLAPGVELSEGPGDSLASALPPISPPPRPAPAPAPAPVPEAPPPMRPAPVAPSAFIIAHPGPGPSTSMEPGAAHQPTVIVSPQASTPQGPALPAAPAARTRSGTSGGLPPAPPAAGAAPAGRGRSSTSGPGLTAALPVLHPSSGSGAGVHPPVPASSGSSPPTLHPSPASSAGVLPAAPASSGSSPPTLHPTSASSAGVLPAAPASSGSSPPVLHPSSASSAGGLPAAPASSGSSPPVLHPSSASGAGVLPAAPASSGSSPPTLHPSSGSGTQPLPRPSSGSDLRRAQASAPPPLPASRPGSGLLGPRSASGTLPTPPPFPPGLRPAVKAPSPSAEAAPLVGPRIAPGVFAPADWRPPGSATPVPAAARPAEDAEEISDAEVQALEQEPEEDEVLGGDEVSPVDADASPPASAINPWLAQLVHGYCPPGAHIFDRPVPPTTTPGREKGSPPGAKAGGRSPV